MNAPLEQLGLVVALPGLLGATVGIPSAALSTRVGRAYMIRSGLVMLLMTGTGYLLAPSLLWLIPSQALLGLAMITYWPSAIATFAEIPGRRSHEFRQGLNSLVQGLGAAAGAGLAATASRALSLLGCSASD